MRSKDFTWWFWKSKGITEEINSRYCNLGLFVNGGTGTISPETKKSPEVGAVR